MPSKRTPSLRYNTSFIERFWSKVDTSGDCWLWTASRKHHGYGRVSSKQSAHRVSWELTHGIIPDGMCVLHHCDNPPCVNPDHLFLGTHTDNMRDMARKGRTGIREQNGSLNPMSKLTDQDVRDIRRTYDAKQATQYQLSDKYGVCQQLISQVVRRKIWRHLS